MKFGAPGLPTVVARRFRFSTRVLDADCECIRYNLTMLEGSGDDPAVRLIH